MFNCIFILGPTASGKTDISIKLAKQLNTEIINADSMQIYKQLNIGTAKPSIVEQDGIKHHLLDIVEPTQEFSVEEYKNAAMPIIVDLINKNKIPIVVGGTGFYVQSLMCDYNYGSSVKDENIRNKYNQLAAQFGNQYVHDILNNIDPISANKIHPNDVKRVIRAIEIFELTGTKKSELHTMQTNTTQQIIKPLIIVLNWDRDQLYDRINQRVDLMINNGLLFEVETLLHNGLTIKNQCMQGIGYKELVDYFNNECSLETCIENIKQATRHYAKRQITWFKQLTTAVWFNLSEVDKNDIINFCINKIKKSEN